MTGKADEVAVSTVVADVDIVNDSDVDKETVTADIDRFIVSGSALDEGSDSGAVDANDTASVAAIDSDIVSGTAVDEDNAGGTVVDVLN